MRKNKLLVFGSAPLPFENTNKNFAAGTRTWQFLEPFLKNDSWEIDVYLMMIRNIYKKKPDNFAIGNVKFHYLTENEIFHSGFLKKIKNDQKKYKAVLAVNNYPSYAVSLFNPEIPFWADLNGYLMAEAQSRAAVEESDNIVRLSWRQAAKISASADKISTSSLPQKFCAIGELALSGRLNQFSNGYDFVEYIPNAVFEKPEIEEKIKPSYPVDKTKFNIFWSSGYNTWADIETLFKGLQKAMEKYPDIRYVSTGGSIPGHDEKTFSRFKKMIDASSFKEKFIFLGWIPKQEVPYYYQNCDLGIVSDKKNYETLIGARNRVNDMMQYELPILTSVYSEISEIVSKNELGLCYKISDPDDLAEKIIWAYENRPEMKAMAEKARTYATENFTPEITTLVIREWLKNPTKAPDYQKYQPLIKVSFSLAGEFFHSLKENGLKITLKYTGKFFRKKFSRL